jgi:hypothetical protein
VVYTFAVLYSSAASRLRRPFLSDRSFFVTVRRLNELVATVNSPFELTVGS